jgi:putative alpha-1,2-mannosidase
VTPGLPVYDLASPVFDRVDIKLHNGKTFSIVCRHNSANNKYVQEIKLNGHPQTRVWIRHGEVVSGGELDLQMGDTPNQSLGSRPEDFPPSALALDPRQFE